MAEEMEVGFVRGRPVDRWVKRPNPETETPSTQTPKEVMKMIQVGKKVPDFVAPGYQKGKFISVKLSEYLGKWVLLCFYPGDFTFV